MTKQIKIGDWVEFKSDWEQCGRVVEIKKGRYGSEDKLVLVNEEGFEGDYIGGQTRTVIFASEAF